MVKYGVQIEPEDIKNLIEDPLEHFYKSFSGRSPITMEHQTRNLKKTLCEFLGPILKGDPDLVQKDKEMGRKTFPGFQNKFSTADFETRAREFVKRAKADPKWGEAVIMKIMHKLEERTKLDKQDPDYLTKGAARNYYFPIQRLLESGSVELPWKRIRRSIPKQTGHGGRSWERSEIQLMIKHCNSEEKPLVVIPAVSGVREGGLWFRWEHIFTVYEHETQYKWEPADVTDDVKKEGKIVCGLIHVYADTQDDDDYFGLLTPECLGIIDEYRRFWTNMWGKPPSPKDPFFRKHGPIIAPLKEAGMRHRMEAIQERCGLRKKLLPNQRRHEVQPFTGFRKFFDKATKTATTQNSLFGKLILNEKMMGHDGLIRLNRNYFREVITELIDEYIPAIPNLTISEVMKREFDIRTQQHIKDSEIRKIVDEAILEKLQGALDLELTRIVNEELQKQVQQLLAKKNHDL